MSPAQRENRGIHQPVNAIGHLAGWNFDALDPCRAGARRYKDGLLRMRCGSCLSNGQRGQRRENEERRSATGIEATRTSRGDRQRDDESGAGARLALHGHLTAVSLHDRSHDGQAEPESRSRPAPIAAIEAIPDAIEVFGKDAGTLVLNGHHDGALPPRLERDPDAAAPRTDLMALSSRFAKTWRKRMRSPRTRQSSPSICSTIPFSSATSS